MIVAVLFCQAAMKSRKNGDSFGKRTLIRQTPSMRKYGVRYRGETWIGTGICLITIPVMPCVMDIWC